MGEKVEDNLFLFSMFKLKVFIKFEKKKSLRIEVHI